MLEGDPDRKYPQINFTSEGHIHVRGTTTMIVRGVVLIDVLDVDNANLNGWFVQPRATLKSEQQAGLVRVCKL